MARRANAIPRRATTHDTSATSRHLSERDREGLLQARDGRAHPARKSPRLSNHRMAPRMLSESLAMRVVATPFSTRDAPTSQGWKRSVPEAEAKEGSRRSRPGTKRRNRKAAGAIRTNPEPG